MTTEQTTAAAPTKKNPRTVRLEELRGIQRQIAQAEIAAHGEYRCMWQRDGEAEALPTLVMASEGGSRDAG